MNNVSQYGVTTLLLSRILILFIFPVSGNLLVTGSSTEFGNNTLLGGDFSRLSGGDISRLGGGDFSRLSGGDISRMGI
jgi:hypothetical protein